MQLCQKPACQPSALTPPLSLSGWDVFFRGQKSVLVLGNVSQENRCFLVQPGKHYLTMSGKRHKGDRVPRDFHGPSQRKFGVVVANTMDVHTSSSSSALNTYHTTCV